MSPDTRSVISLMGAADWAGDIADVLMDGALSWGLLKPGGVLMFDDYEWSPGLPAFMCPKAGVDAFLRLIDGQHELLHRGYQVILRKPLA